MEGLLYFKRQFGMMHAVDGGGRPPPGPKNTANEYRIDAAKLRAHNLPHGKENFRQRRTGVAPVSEIRKEWRQARRLSYARSRPAWVRFNCMIPAKPYPVFGASSHAFSGLTPDPMPSRPMSVTTVQATGQPFQPDRSPCLNPEPSDLPERARPTNFSQKRLPLLKGTSKPGQEM